MVYFLNLYENVQKYTRSRRLCYILTKKGYGKGERMILASSLVIAQKTKREQERLQLRT